MSGAGPDSTLLWALERLSAERLSHDSLIIVLRELKDVHGPALNLPDLLKVRITLNSLAGAEVVSGPLLRELQLLRKTVSFSEDGDIIPFRDYLNPPDELLLQVKTELVVQTWRDSVMCSKKHIKDRINAMFGDPCPESDIPKYNELMAAAVDPAKRLHVGRQMEGEVALQGVKRFAAAAIQALPPPFLSFVNDDINAALYAPGNMEAKLDAVRAEGAQHAQQLHQAAMFPAAQAYPLQATLPVPPALTSAQMLAGVPQQRMTPVRVVSPYGDAGAGPSVLPRDEFAPVPGGGDERSPAGTAAKRQRLQGQFDNLRDARGGLQAVGGADPLQQANAIAEAVASAAVQAAERMGAVPPGSAARLEQRLTSPEAGLPAPLPALPVAAPAAVPPLQRQTAVPAPRPPPPSNGPNIRRKTVRWTPEETRALLDGVYEYGRQWALIHDRYKEIFGVTPQCPKGVRTNMDLKDKWRILERQKNPECLSINAYWEANPPTDRRGRPPRSAAAAAGTGNEEAADDDQEQAENDDEGPATTQEVAEENEGGDEGEGEEAAEGAEAAVAEGDEGENNSAGDDREEEQEDEEEEEEEGSMEESAGDVDDVEEDEEGGDEDGNEEAEEAEGEPAQGKRAARTAVAVKSTPKKRGRKAGQQVMMVRRAKRLAQK